MRFATAVLACALSVSCGTTPARLDAGVDAGAFDGGSLIDGGADDGGDPDAGALDGGAHADAGADGGLVDGGADGGGEDGGADAGPFLIVRFTPPPGTTFFQDQREFFIDFNRTVDSSTVTTTNVLMLESSGAEFFERPIELTLPTSTRVRVATFAGGGRLFARWRFRLIAKQGIRDTAGMSLDRAYDEGYSAPRLYYFTTFGPPNQGFTQESNVFEWGFGPDGGPGRCYPATGAYCWTTGLSGKHPALDPEVRDGGVVWGRVPADRLISPPIDLEGAIDPMLEYYQWYQLGLNDFGQGVAARVEVEATPDGGWQVLFPIGRVPTTSEPFYRRTRQGALVDYWNGSSGGGTNYSYAGPPDWETARFDLRPFVGRTIRLGFHFYTEDPGAKYEQMAGWYIDEVMVYQGDPAILPPLPPDGGG
jgi:hypothetical protein